MTEREMIAMTERRITPEQWRALYPKVYEYNPTGYCSPKFLSAIFANALMNKADEFVNYRSILVSRHIQYSMPIMWLDARLADAMRQTTPPNSYDIFDLPLPMPAMTILLPRGLMQSPKGGAARSISFARLEEEELRNSFGMVDQDGPALFFLTAFEDGHAQAISFDKRISTVDLSKLDEFEQSLAHLAEVEREYTEPATTKAVMFYFIRAIIYLTTPKQKRRFTSWKRRLNQRLYRLQSSTFPALTAAAST
jgi:hypothetical protein